MLNLEDIEKEQDERIRYLLQLAYNHNQYLHQLLDTAGVKPENVKPGDSKKVLQEAYQKGLRTYSEDLVQGKLYPDYVYNIFTAQIWTSGTTGRPKVVLYSKDDLNRNNRQVLTIYNILKIESGKDGIVGFVAPFPFATAFMIPASFHELNVPSVTFMPPPITPQMSPDEIKFRLRAIYEAMRRIGESQVIIGGTYGIEKLGILFNKYGFDTNLLNIKALAFGAEPTTLERRERISKSWQKSKSNITYDLYASSEGSTMAFECSAHGGLHVDQPEVYIFAGDREQPLTEGVQGYDVVTLLPEVGAKPGTFFINYSHGDMLGVSPSGCECGLPYYKISYPRREVEQIRIAGCGLDVRDLERMLNMPPYTGEYLVVWEQPKGETVLHKLKIRVEVAIISSHTVEDYRRQLVSSNPLAYDLLFTSGSVEVEVENVEPGKAYAGFEKFTNPGKSTRLVKI